MNKGKVELTSFKKTNDAFVFEYSVEQNNGKTSVEQSLTIRSSDGLFQPDWIAEITLDDFPPQKAPHEAAIKLADWMERLAAAIRSGDYMPLQHAEFKDLGE